MNDKDQHEQKDDVARGSHSILIDSAEPWLNPHEGIL